MALESSAMRRTRKTKQTPNAPQESPPLNPLSYSPHLPLNRPNQAQQITHLQAIMPHRTQNLLDRFFNKPQEPLLTVKNLLSDDPVHVRRIDRAQLEREL
ncbi:hypothetical protein Slin15195_G117340 [Septoria linicola]|uniref:Uncharacterized protein n=1 Tax=Septoria linicola TaxID=215465 RepID=A0A9Q9B0F9_9PEZI|nr:hypothetical protein Slin15195_G117340 [Septoria linicola]